MTHILHRQISHDYPVALGGQGILVQDANGKEYIDASGGAAVSCLGHSHPDVVAAMTAQLSNLEYAHSSFFTTRVAEDLADDLVAHAPKGTMCCSSAAVRRLSKQRSNWRGNFLSSAGNRSARTSLPGDKATTA